MLKSKEKYFMYTKTNKRHYHTDMPLSISKLTAIMVALVPLMENKKLYERCIAKLAKVQYRVVFRTPSKIFNGAFFKNS